MDIQNIQLKEVMGELYSRPASEKKKEDRQKLIRFLAKVPMESKLSRAHLIVCADRSGSMSGNPWKQVQDSLCDMIEQSFVSSNLIEISLITFDSVAETIKFTQQNFESVIRQCNPRGMTSFSAAFQEIKNVLQRSLSKDYDETCVVFMTDGQNTEGDPVQARADLHRYLQSLPFETFSQKNGKSRGHFSICGKWDGREALQTKFSEIFDLVYSTRVTSAQVTIHVEGATLFPNGSLESDPSSLPSQLTLSLPISRENEIEINQWVWFPKGLPGETPILSLTFSDGEAVSQTFAIPLEVRLISTPGEKILWKLRKLSQWVTDISQQIVSQKGDNFKEEKWKQSLEKAQKNLDDVKYFGGKIPKASRTEIFHLKGYVQHKLNALHSLLAEFQRGASSVATLAKANDIRFTGHFKARRQRLMDQRASKNAEEAQQIDDILKNLSLDSERIESFSKECEGFFACDLSQQSVKDILLDQSDPSEILGFGVAVKRPECVIDDPTLIQIDTISSTVVTQSSIQDAIKFSINVDQKLNAHGGFNPYELGVALKGRAREPINAWLPFYIHEEHWKRVRVMMKPILGYFCTLDPLGFSTNQFDCMFMILGTMISRLSDPGEHQLRIVFAFQRTCAQMALDFDLIPLITERVTQFADSPEFRTKDVIPSLMALLGYLAVLPPNILGSSHGAFWVAFLDESIRRGCHVIFHSSTPAVTNGVVHSLVHGEDAEEALPDEEAVKQFFLQHQQLDEPQLDVENLKFDPLKSFIAPVRPTTSNLKEDKKMEKFAKKELGYIREDTRAVRKEKKSSEAKPETEKEKPTHSFDPHRMTPSMVITLIRLQNELQVSGFPSPVFVYRFMKYISAWNQMRSEGKDLTEELDQNYGVAPESWVTRIKSALPPATKVPNLLDLLEIVEAPSTDRFLLLKAMAVQGLLYHANKKATKAIKAGKYGDVKDPNAAIEILSNSFEKLEKKKEKAKEDAISRMLCMEDNRKLLSTDNFYAFLGYLFKMYKIERGEGFRELCDMIHKSPGQIPLLEEKVKVLLTGKFEGHPVIARGNPWVPESDNRRKFIASLGMQSYLQLEILVRGSIAVHVYRESDIPNRHGHCNSNPYLGPMH